MCCLVALGSVSASLKKLGTPPVSFQMNLKEYHLPDEGEVEDLLFHSEVDAASVLVSNFLNFS